MTLIHGEQDGNAPFETALDYCAMYPAWRFVGYPDEGEFVAHVRWPEVLDLIEQSFAPALAGAPGEALPPPPRRSPKPPRFLSPDRCAVTRGTALMRTAGSGSDFDPGSHNSEENVMPDILYVSSIVRTATLYFWLLLLLDSPSAIEPWLRACSFCQADRCHYSFFPRPPDALQRVSCYPMQVEGSCRVSRTESSCRLIHE